ncbi:MAG: deoxyribonuclease II family protein, partial [bacterium]
TSNFLANNLIINKEYIYDQNITASAAAALPQFESWLNKVKTTVTNSSKPFESFGGKEYFQFAKSVSWGMDLWDDLVAPYFRTPLNVETWRLGSGGRMGSICGPNASGIVEYN